MVFRCPLKHSRVLYSDRSLRYSDIPLSCCSYIRICPHVSGYALPYSDMPQYIQINVFVNEFPGHFLDPDPDFQAVVDDFSSSFAMHLNPIFSISCYKNQMIVERREIGREQEEEKEESWRRRKRRRRMKGQLDNFQVSIFLRLKQASTLLFLFLNSTQVNPPSFLCLICFLSIELQMDLFEDYRFVSCQFSPFWLDLCLDDGSLLVSFEGLGFPSVCCWNEAKMCGLVLVGQCRNVNVAESIMHVISVIYFQYFITSNAYRGLGICIWGIHVTYMLGQGHTRLF